MLSQIGFWDSRLTLRLTLASPDVYSCDLQGKEIGPSQSFLPPLSLLLTGVGKQWQLSWAIKLSDKDGRAVRQQEPGFLALQTHHASLGLPTPRYFYMRKNKLHSCFGYCYFTVPTSPDLCEIPLQSFQKAVQ